MRVLHSVADFKESKFSIYGKSFRNRFGDHQLLHGRDGGWRPRSIGKQRRRAHYAFSGCVYEKWRDRKSTRLNSSHVRISYAVFCLKKKKNELMFDTSLCD